MKQVPIQVDIVGQPETGYQVGNVYCNPPLASLVGSTEALESIIFLQLDNIDVSGHSNSVTRTFLLDDYLPEGISIAKNYSDTVQVIVNISPQSQRQVVLANENLTILGQESGLTYEIIGEAQITIAGNEPETILPEELMGILHVNGLAIGEHRVMIHTELPDGVELTPSYVTIRISEETPAENE